VLTESERAAMTARLRRGREKGTGKVPRRPDGLAELPLSYGQEQLWFLDRFAPGLPTYNIPLAFQLTGRLDPAALGRAMDTVVARHEALRTRLVAGPAGRPAQVIDLPPAGVLELAELPDGEPEQRRAAMREFLDAEAVRPFDLAAGPLLRTWLLPVSPSEHVLVLVAHHTVFDGWSIGVLVRELAALYAAEATGQPSGLDEPPVQFADYALWERERLSGTALAELEEYWRKAMDGFETVQFPTDRPRPALDSFDGSLAIRHAGPDLVEGLRELSRREGTTLSAALIASLLALLRRYTGQDDLVIGIPSANRSRRDLAPLIGYLVNTLPVRADLSGDPPFTELLARVKEATTGAYAHQDLPLAKMVESLEVPRDASRAPIFQITMNNSERQEAPVTAAGVNFLLSGEDLALDFSAAKFDLDLSTEASEEGLKLGSAYKSALFDAGSIERLLGGWEVLLRGVVADPSARLSRLPVLTEAELEAELRGWNDTAGVVPPGCVQERFEAQAAVTPAAPAARFGDQQWSYAQLNAAANQIARRLRAAGAGPEQLTGVCLTAGLQRLAGMLGTWKAGGGFVPLDPDLPADRLAFMIADTGMTTILTSTASRPAVGDPGPGVTVIPLDAEWDQITGLDDADLPVTETGVTPQNTAYVIYTSGSTGQPKGVVVEHAQAANFLHGQVTTWQVTPADTVLQFSAFTFDVSIMDTWMPLLAGATVVLAGKDTLHSPPRLAALIRDQRITIACLPPAVLNLLTDQDFPALRVLVTAGEEVPAGLARAWTRPGLRTINGYGPTEATVLATCHELDGTYPPPIGLPVWPNYQVYVLDAHLRPVPAGVLGELHIGGAGVARGYLNRPDLTAARFIDDPFRPGGRLYKTGDLVRRRPDGNIIFTGRVDDQVKIHGLRIELGEIETALYTHPAIAQAIVTVTTTTTGGGTGTKELAAYIRPEPGSTPAPDTAAIRAHLAKTLPDYMIPAHLITLTEFPLNPSGKIDRAQLPPPQAQANAGYVAPATLIETVLADMYATLLGLEQVGATDSFFDVGGSSLQAMRLVSLMAEELEVDLGVAEVFLAPAPRQLAALLRDKFELEDADLGEEG
jgi:amino acid adenylation domain-containing protein